MSVVSGIPSRVICRTCKSEHNYKPKKGIKDSAVLRSSRETREKSEKRAEKTVPVELEWMKQINSSPRPVRPYAANESFTLGDRVNHPTFGEGVVQKLLHPNKIEIIFRSDIKVLIHAGSAKS